MTVSAIWPNGVGLVVSLVVNVEEGAQMSPLDGDGLSEPVDELGVTLRGVRPNLANDSNYRYGLNEGFDRIAGVLDKTGTPATWTCAAVALERKPLIANYITGRGDEIACHGHRWVHQFRMSQEEERQFIQDGTAIIEKVSGQRPVGYLARYLFTESTRRILHEEGYLYDMNDYSADFPFWDRTPGGPIVVLPYALDTNDMKMWTAQAYTPDSWLRYLTDTLGVLRDEGERRPVMMSVGVHLRVAGRPGRIGTWQRFIEEVLEHDIPIATRADIAKRFIEMHPSDEA